MPGYGTRCPGCARRAPTASPKWLLPVVRDNPAAGGEVALSAAIVASCARYAEAVDEDGDPIEVVDRLRDSLVAVARRQREEPLAFIAQRELFGDLVDDERFVAPTCRAELATRKGGHGRRWNPWSGADSPLRPAAAGRVERGNGRSDQEYHRTPPPAMSSAVSRLRRLG